MILFDDQENKVVEEQQVVEESQTSTESVAQETKEVARTEKEHFAKNETKFEKKSSKKAAKPRASKTNKKQTEFEEKIIDIARVTTVVKGGRRFSFSAIVVVGNKKGKVGIGHGKANEVPDAIKKAVKNAQSNFQLSINQQFLMKSKQNSYLQEFY